MNSKGYRGADRVLHARSVAPTMQRLHRVRTKVTKARSKGFTLIEMMVVVAILTIVAAITFAGIQQDRYEGSYREFVQDITGTIQRARQTAIDNQTRTRLDIYRDRVEVYWERPLDPFWDPNDPVPANALTFQMIDEAHREEVAGGALAANDDVCIFGLYRGIIVDGSGAQAEPNGCMGNMQRLFFFPDGHMEWDGVNLNGSGVSIVTADTRTPNNPLVSHVQVFPGGMIRKFDNRN